MKPWEKDWSGGATPSPFDAALEAEGVTGQVADIARSIYEQESGSGKNTTTSNAGARGAMQILPGTFQRVADKGWNIDDPVHNARAGIRYAQQMHELAGGDPALTAAGYYGGPGGLEKARKGIAVSDPRNPGAPNTLQYGAQVAARVPAGSVAQALDKVASAVLPTANAQELPAGKMPWDMDWGASTPAGGKPAQDQTPETQQQAAKPRSWIDDLGHQLGLTARAAVTGAASVPAMAADALIVAPANAALSAYDKVAGNKEPSFRFKSQTQALNDVMTSAGVAVPENATERVVQDAASSVAGAGSVAKAGLAMAKYAGGAATRGVGAMLAEGSGASGTGRVGQLVSNQGLSAATGAGASGIVRENGGSEGAQIVAGLAGAMLPSAVAVAGRKPNGSKQLGAAAAKANEAGYVVPPADLNPSPAVEALSAVSGKVKTAQVASQRNQQVTNDLARKALGMQKDADLTIDALSAIRKQAGQAYQVVAESGEVTPSAKYAQAIDDAIKPFLSQNKSFPNRKLPALVDDIQALKTERFDAGDAIETIKVLRDETTAAFNAGNKTAGKAYKQASKALEDALDDHLVKIGASPDVLNGYRDARQTIAKTYTVEKALNPQTGNVNAQKLASELAKGKVLSGDLKTIAEVGKAFPKAMQNLKESPKQVGVVDIGTGFLSSVGRETTAGKIASFAAPLLGRPIARSAVLSGPMQRAAVKSAGKVLDPDLKTGIPAVAFEAATRASGTPQPADPTVITGMPWDHDFAPEPAPPGPAEPAPAEQAQPAPRIELDGMATPNPNDLVNGQDAPLEDPEAVPGVDTSQADYDPATAFTSQPRPDGTLAISGDTQAMRAMLVKAGIPARSLTPMKDGLLVGRTQATKVQQAIERMHAAAAPAPQDGGQVNALANAAPQDQNTAMIPLQNDALAPANITQTATQSIADVQDPQAPIGAQAQAAPIEAREAIAGDATAAQDVPGAGGLGGLQADGLGAQAPIDYAAHGAATSPQNELPEPTEAQKRAGNYRLGHDRIAGMDVAIENPQGSVRRGVDPDGKPWETQMQHHYGYFKRTTANDGDKLDVFIKPGTPKDFAGPVFVIDQVDPRTGKLDEHKTILGAATEDEAKAIYKANYSDDWQGMGSITRLPMPVFKAWAASGSKKEPLGDLQASMAPPEAGTSDVAQSSAQPTTDPRQDALSKIQRLKESGETEVAAMLQKSFDREQASVTAPAELAAMRETAPDLPHHQSEEFAQTYAQLRNTGAKPAEAAARAGLLAAVTDQATAIGLPQKAMAALTQQLGKMPLDDAPGFAQRFITGLIKRGVMQDFQGADQVGAMLVQSRDGAMHSALNGLYGDNHASNA